MALMFFLALSGYVVQALKSSYGAQTIVSKVYAKQQAYHVLVSALPYILTSLRREDTSYDALSDPWAFPFTVETERGKLEVVIYDEDRFINVNFLDNPTLRRIFERLLTLLNISPVYSERVLMWIGKSRGTFESEYPLKRAPMDTPHELSFLGFSYEDLYGRTEGDVTYPGLLSLVTTFSYGKINVNTAPKYILMALDRDIDSALADKIIEFRERNPFRNTQDLVSVEGFTLDTLYRIQNVIDVKSKVFRIVATLELGEVETTLEVVYDREQNRILYKRIY